MTTTGSTSPTPQALLIAAIMQSRESLDDFVTTFRHPARTQTDFMVVILQEEQDAYVPVGILLDGIDQGTFSGRRVANTLTAQPTEHITCRAADIVDWRYVDTLEMEGGALYRELYARLPSRTKFAIRDKQPFVIARDNEREMIDTSTLHMFRDLAHGRCDRVEGLHTSRDLGTSGMRAPMPVLTFDIGRKVIIYPVTVPEYAAMYGNARIIDGLYSRGVLYDKPGDFSPLAESCLAGNIETTERLLELGFDVDALNGAPLHNAVAGNHVDVVLVLVRKGVDVNVRGVRNETPLFHARSVEVAKALIEAGADVNAKDDAGVTCLDSHLFHSRNAMTFEREHSIVRLLLQHRAHHREPLVEEAPPDAQTILGEAAKRGDAGAAGLLDSITSGDAVDFGCVLPVRSIPKSALGGILPAS
jgi:hypothetical protein